MGARYTPKKRREIKARLKELRATDATPQDIANALNDEGFTRPGGSRFTANSAAYTCRQFGLGWWKKTSAKVKSTHRVFKTHTPTTHKEMKKDDRDSELVDLIVKSTKLDKSRKLAILEQLL